MKPYHVGIIGYGWAAQAIAADRSWQENRPVKLAEIRAV